MFFFRFKKKDFELEVKELLEYLSFAEGILYERPIFKAALVGKMKFIIRSCVKNCNCGYKY